MKYFAVLGTLPYPSDEANVIYTGNALFYIKQGSAIESVIELTRNELHTKNELIRIADGVIKSKSLPMTGKSLVSYLIASGIYGAFSGINKRFAWLRFSDRARFTLPFIKGFFESEAEKSPEMFRSWLEPAKYFSKLEQSMLNYLIFQQRECLKDIFGDEFEDKMRASYPEFILRYDLSEGSGIFRIPKYKGVPSCAINAGICNLFMQRCLIVMAGFSSVPKKIALSEEQFK